MHDDQLSMKESSKSSTYFFLQLFLEFEAHATNSIKRKHAAEQVITVGPTRDQTHDWISNCCSTSRALWGNKKLEFSQRKTYNKLKDKKKKIKKNLY